MIVDLSTVVFSNDLFTVEVEELNSTLILYRLNENFKSESAETSIKVNRILVALADSDGVQHKATSIVGLSVDGVSIQTNVDEFKGQPLNSENMQYCSIALGEDA